MDSPFLTLSLVVQKLLMGMKQVPFSGDFHTNAFSTRKHDINWHKDSKRATYNIDGAEELQLLVIRRIQHSKLFSGSLEHHSYTMSPLESAVRSLDKFLQISKSSSLPQP